MTVDVHIGYVGRSNNIKAVVTTCIRQRLTEDTNATNALKLVYSFSLKHAPGQRIF